MKPADVPDGPLVIDTDVASWIRAGNSRAEPFKPLMRDHVLCLSFATVAELWAGAENAGWGQARRDGLESFIRVHVILPVDEAVTRCWAKIHAVLRDQVDVNDEWTPPALSPRHPRSASSPAISGISGQSRQGPTLTIVHPDE